MSGHRSIFRGHSDACFVVFRMDGVCKALDEAVRRQFTRERSRSGPIKPYVEFTMEDVSEFSTGGEGVERLESPRKAVVWRAIWPWPGLTARDWFEIDADRVRDFLGRLGVYKGDDKYHPVGSQGVLMFCDELDEDKVMALSGMEFPLPKSVRCEACGHMTPLP